MPDLPLYMQNPWMDGEGRLICGGCGKRLGTLRHRWRARWDGVCRGNEEDGKRWAT